MEPKDKQCRGVEVSTTNRFMDGCRCDNIDSVLAFSLLCSKYLTDTTQAKKDLFGPMICQSFKEKNLDSLFVCCFFCFYFINFCLDFVISCNLLVLDLIFFFNF